jgi:hypothetical protein
MNGNVDSHALEERLLPDRITIRKPVQSFIPGSKKPVFDYQVVATGVAARFNPQNTTLQRNVMGQTPKKRFELFLNVVDLLENYEIVKEDTHEVFVVIEAKNLYGHHLEVVAESAK